ncbi:MAG: acyltransferase [Ferruginibacter sp.]|nr:acyltransferase [Ferruginibacter sp.]
MKHIKGLDSLRAIAVLLVIPWHWLPPEFIKSLPVGPAGVTIFFVLSGFLITRILLEGKCKTEAEGKGKASFIANFVFRRALRILPIYYLLVIPALCYAILKQQDLEKFAYLLTFTSNFYFLKINAWDTFFSHTWTLAIEEQFYLVWPLVLVFVNRKYLLPVILGFIVLGVASQVAIQSDGFRMYQLYACCDSFGVGALLAWVIVFKPTLLKSFFRVSAVLALATLVFLYIQLFHLPDVIVPLRIQVSVITVCCISYMLHASTLSTPMPAYLSVLINNNTLAAIGKISYGMYLYHIFIPKLTGVFIYGTVYKHLPVFIRDHFQFFIFPINFAVLVIVSSLSWKYFEQPILRFKKYSFFRENAVWKFRSTKQAA